LLTRPRAARRRSHAGRRRAERVVARPGTRPGRAWHAGGRPGRATWPRRTGTGARRSRPRIAPRSGAGAVGGRPLRTGRGLARRSGFFRLRLRERHRWPARRPVCALVRVWCRCGRAGRLGCCRCGPGLGRRRSGRGRATAIGGAVPVIGSCHCGRGRCRRRTAVCSLAGPRLLGLLGRECFLEPADDRRLDRRRRRSHELAHFLELGHHGLALYAELLSELVYPDLRHCAPSTRSGLAGPVSRSGQRVLRPASASAVHRRMLIGRSSQSQPAFPGRVATAVCLPSASSPGSRCQPPPFVRTSTGAAGRACPKILDDRAGLERSGQAQRPRKRPAALRFLKASRAGMQVRTPARSPRWRVGNDLVPGSHQAEQVGLDGAGPAAYAGPDRWRVPSLRMPRAHLRQAYSATPRGDDPPSTAQ
jgi:hypothetical protein